MTASQDVRMIRASEQATLLEGPLGAVEMLPNGVTGGRLALVLRPLAARSLGSPMHTHQDEDEYSVVLEGVIGVQVGDLVTEAEVGDVVCKPRGVPHAFWNPSEKPARLLEVITPGGFAGYFAELQAVLRDGMPDPAALAELTDRFHLTMDLESVPGLVERHGLRLGP